MKSIIFDLGAVMVDWNPNAIAQKFTRDTKLQNAIIHGLFHHDNWLDFDNGLITEHELIERSCSKLKLSHLNTQKLMQHAKDSLCAKHDMVALLKLAKSEGLRTFCLSNLSHEWFAYLSQRHDFFKFFDGKVISAQEGIGKPNPLIYQRLLNRFDIHLSNVLFIDDRLDNTLTAEALGIKAITFKHSNEDLNKIQQFILH